MILFCKKISEYFLLKSKTYIENKVSILIINYTKNQSMLTLAKAMAIYQYCPLLCKQNMLVWLRLIWQHGYIYVLKVCLCFTIPVKPGVQHSVGKKLLAVFFFFFLKLSKLSYLKIVSLVTTQLMSSTVKISLPN